MAGHTHLASWKKLSQLAASTAGLEIKRLFSEDGQRFDKYSLTSCGILFDYSKNRITDSVKASLLQLAQESHVESWRSAMFAGEAINHTEGREVLHTALRNSGGTIDQANSMQGQRQQAIAQELERIKNFSQQVRQGLFTGYSDSAITDVVCLGVGGSHLGPSMVTDALAGSVQAEQPVELHYISSVDAVPLVGLLAKLKPETTLFIVSSKTFTTSETLLNAASAKQWLQQQAPLEAVSRHFVAVTAAVDKAQAFGIAEQNCFKIWDWVGGRFSLWSAIGLPIAIGLGFEAFSDLLAGAKAMDEHFCTAELADNLPVMMALVGIWNSTFLKINTLAILPYDQNLHSLPAYLQQAEMESNGKSVDWQGDSLPYTTCPVLWGQTGINGQHAFYQLLHQGTHQIACDFIASAKGCCDEPLHHKHLLANFFAQTQALMDGVSATAVRKQLMDNGIAQEKIERLVPHKVHAGNRSSNSLLLDQLDAYHLGALIALYEHKIFVQGIVWKIYSFDQWGLSWVSN